MSKKETPPNSDQARKDLDDIDKIQMAARRRGVMSLGAAALASAWVGLMATMVLDDYEYTFVFFLMGAVLLVGYQHKKGAMVLEFAKGKSLSGIIFHFLGAIAIVGGGIYLAKTYPVDWAPKAIGAALGLYIFGLLVLAHRKTWAALKKDSE